jgi:hypothetical protein
MEKREYRAAIISAMGLLEATLCTRLENRIGTMSLDQ